MALAAAVIGLSTTTPAFAAPTSYELDATHTWVFYEIVHFGTSTNRGRFPIKPGKVQIDAQARTGQLDVTIDTSAPASGVPALDRMMQGDRLFRSSEFPTARFVSTAMRFDGDKPSEVRGELTLLGVTHPVTLTSQRFNCYTNAMLKREVCGGDFETTIRRSRWGMDWAPHLVADDVRLLIQVEAVKQAD
ncbi:MAG: YceI family protein [Pseudomonadota bacterium]